MPLFKKFILFIFIISIILISIYTILCNYAINNGSDKDVFKNTNYVLNNGFKDLYHSFILQFIDSFSDTIIYIFTFRYNRISVNEKCFFIVIGLTSIPFLITLFQFLTYRGFQAFKLRIKKAKANPFYYRDYVEANKEYGNDNIEETDLSLLPILITIRIVVVIVI